MPRAEADNPPPAGRSAAPGPVAASLFPPNDGRIDGAMSPRRQSRQCEADRWGFVRRKLYASGHLRIIDLAGRSYQPYYTHLADRV